MNRTLVILICLVLLQSVLHAQSCPPNIGFENGNFQNWSIDTGSINPDGTYDLKPSAPVFGRHTLLKNAAPFPFEVFGQFPMNAPNGSNFTAQLGSINPGKTADRMTYTINVPTGQSEYNVLINYAIVFESNKTHYAHQQAAFDFEIIDDQTNKRIDCLSFNYIGTSDQPGVSTVPNTDIHYRKWSLIPLKLAKYAGKTLRLEFTARHCIDGNHFAYAYIDINENCKSFITGNIVCDNASQITLYSPLGFTKYRWFNSNFSQVLGTSNTLTIPTPPDGTVIPLEVTYNPAYNCKDTFYTTIKYVAGGFMLVIPPSVTACPQPFDLTAPYITAGSSPDITLSYFSDANQISPIPQPKAVEKPGMYYIKAENNIGCVAVKGLQLNFLDTPKLIVHPPPTVCVPQTVNLTHPTVTTGSDNDLVFSYWQDLDTTKPLLQPNAVGKTGTYFIKGTNKYGCTIVESIAVTTADLYAAAVSGCGEVLLKDLVFGSDYFNYTVWKDTNATIPAVIPEKITSDMKFFVKGTAKSIGCSVIRPFEVTVYPIAMMTVSDPAPAFFPATVDITKNVSGNAGQQYWYWRDPMFSVPLVKEKKIDSSGTYYVTAKNSYGCSTSAKINVVILPPPPVKVTVGNAFSPNNDGINDRFEFKWEGKVVFKILRIYDRDSHLVFQSHDIHNMWRGLNQNNKPVAMGTYYWVIEFEDFYQKKKFVKTGSVSVIR